MQQHNQQRRRKEFLFKILVIGDLGSGKTSIIKRYVHEIFSGNYKSTIGVDFALKVLQVPYPVPDVTNDDHNGSSSSDQQQKHQQQELVTVRLQLWDVAGQERYGNMTRVYFKDAVAALIVLDSTRLGNSTQNDTATTAFSSTAGKDAEAALEGAVKWKQDLDSKVTMVDYSRSGEPVEQPVPVVLLANKADTLPAAPQLDQFCQEHGFQRWFTTSAKDGTGIEEAVMHLVSVIMQNEAARDEHIRIHGPIKSEKKNRNTVPMNQNPNSKSNCCN